MQHPQGTIFLSHSSLDKSFVDKVYKELDAAATFYDVKTIAPGAQFIEEMKRGVADGAVFVLFHSPNTKGTWVEYETQLAEVAVASRQSAFLVCPIGGETYRSLPDWMKDRMTTSEDYTVSDIVRAILYQQRQVISSRLGKEPAFVGREELLNKIHLEVLQAVPKRGQPIQHMVITGMVGMGRTTLAKHSLNKSLPMLRKAGPVFDLPDMAEAVDFYLAFKEDLDGLMTKEQMQEQIAVFSELGPKEQAKTILRQASHWAELNQPILVRSRWGLRDRTRNLKEWFDEFVQASLEHPNLRMIYISERRLPDEEVAMRANLRQFSVEGLSSTDIQVLLSELVEPRLFDAAKSETIAKLVGGHPATAHHASVLINGGRNIATLEANPEPITSFQQRSLSELIDGDFLSEDQKKIVALLGVFPKLSFKMIARTLEIERRVLTEEIWDLVDYSLLQSVDNEYYSCPDMVASYARRNLAGLSTPLLGEIKASIEADIEGGVVDSQLISALLIAAVETSGNIPEELSLLLTSSSLLEIVRSQFDRAQSHKGNSKEMFEAVYKLSRLAFGMNVSDDAVEQILFSGGDSAIRAGVFPQDIIEVMERNALPAVYYLRGSYAFHVKRDWDTSISQLRQALRLKHFRLRTSRLLTRALIRNQQFSDALEVLNRLPDYQINRESGLVVMKIRAMRGLRLFKEAEQLEATLKSDNDLYGEVPLFKAGKFLREMNLVKAKEQISLARKAPRVNQLSCQLLECAIRLEDGDASLLPATVEMANAVNRQSDAFQMQARYAVVEGRWADAEEYLSNISRKDYYDLQVEKRCLELKMSDLTIVRDPVAIKACQNRLEEITLLSARAPEGFRNA
ncbi:TIR domain-containing protein [Ruegeria denitrificans]|uniref:TIR domain-containing protein n=1 Tax=Ruegeria denitrificans TaxID=1715692 RepID=UPI003C7C6A97